MRSSERSSDAGLGREALAVAHWLSLSLLQALNPTHPNGWGPALIADALATQLVREAAETGDR